MKRQLKCLREANPESEWFFPAKHNAGSVNEEAITKQLRDRQREKQLKGQSPAVKSLCLPGGDWCAYDLRRTAAMRLQKLGVNPPVIDAILNRAEPNRLNRIYLQHDYREEKRDAWLRLGAYLQSLLRKKSKAA